MPSPIPLRSLKNYLTKEEPVSHMENELENFLHIGKVKGEVISTLTGNPR